MASEVLRFHLSHSTCSGERGDHLRGRDRRRRHDLTLAGWAGASVAEADSVGMLDRLIILAVVVERVGALAATGRRAAARPAGAQTRRRPS